MKKKTLSIAILLIVLILVMFSVIPMVETAGHENHYNLKGKYWHRDDMPVKYYVEQELIDLGFLAAIRQAFQTWEDDPLSQIDFDYAGAFPTDPDDRKYDANYKNEVRLAPEGDGVGGNIAMTASWFKEEGTSPLYEEVDIRLDKAEQWSTTGEAGKYDVQNVLTHECGHALGLNDYNDCSDETMYGEVAHAETKKRDLFEGDIAGLRAIYGNATGGVGGIIIPIDKFALLAPYIGLTSTTIIAAVATAVYVKRVKRRKEKQ